MASFPIPDPNLYPNLPGYLFEADLAMSIIAPSSYTAVPTTSLGAYLHWVKNDLTSDDGDLYTEVYRSTDLETWVLITTLGYPITVYTDDSELKGGSKYYYRVRFVRKNAAGTITKVSHYTTLIGIEAVSSLAVEPRDTYSNKFLAFLIDALPGVRVYDHTKAAHFSADEHLWQTNAKFVGGFDVLANGSVVERQSADATAIYNKRPISFVLTNRYNALVAREESTGTEGELIRVHTYLIDTFLMGYAIQFLTLYEQYQQILANKYYTVPAIYTKGFKPLVADQKDITIGQLYLSFGKMMRLKSLQAQTEDQGVDRYKQSLQDNFSNVEELGKHAGVMGAAESTLGITQQTFFEFYKYHWFKSDRDFKLYTLGSGQDTFYLSTGLPNGANNDLIYTINSGYEHYAMFIEYFAERVDPSAGGWLEVYNSSMENPYQYIMRVHASEGLTTAAQANSLISAYPGISTIMAVANSGGDSGAGVLIPQYVLPSGEDAIPSGVTGLNYYGPLAAVRHSPWLAWENAGLKLNRRSYGLEDDQVSEPGVDGASMSRILSETDPTIVFDPTSISLPSGATENIINTIGVNNMLAARDDDSAGVDYDGTTLVGEKRIVFRMDLTPNNMSWVNKAFLKLHVIKNTHAGYIRLYRIRKVYDENHVCWEHRDEESVTGYNWNGSSYVSNTTDWVTAYWDEDGAEGAKDALFLKEFYVEQIDSAKDIYLDITDVLQELYKYECSNLNLSQNIDPENILDCGFMITAENLPDRSMFVCGAHSDVNFKPLVEWERLYRGYYDAGVAGDTKYFYVDGTTKFGRLLVMQSDREPISYVKTVHERIRNNELKYTSSIKLQLSAAVPATYVVDERVYGLTSKAVGKITSVGDTSIFVSAEIGKFSAGETLRLLDTPDSVTATLSSLSYTGDKYLELSRNPEESTLLKVYYTGASTTDASAPSAYPDYEPWTEEGDGIRPVFLTSPPGGVTEILTAELDAEHPNRINLNTSVTQASLGDIIVTYQYEYNFVMLGRVITDDGGVQFLEGCTRLDNQLYSMSENDAKYQSQLMLPMPSTAEYLPEISGGADPSGYEYSDYNKGILCDAVANIRRYNGKIDVFKYDPTVKSYQFNQLYHTFFRRA